MKTTICIEDTEVEGKITHRSASDITIEITKPYQHISTGSHIPCFSRAYNSFDGTYGDKTAESLLKNLYDIGYHLDMEMIRIGEKLDSAKDSISNLPLKFDHDEFIKNRRELKLLLKQELLDNKTYQKELTSLRKKAEECNQKVDEIMSTFFEDSFPMCVPYGMRDGVLEIIMGKKALFADRAH